MKTIQRDWNKFDAAFISVGTARQKISISAASKYNVSVLFGIDYSFSAALNDPLTKIGSHDSRNIIHQNNINIDILKTLLDVQPSSHLATTYWRCKFTFKFTLKCPQLS